VQLEVQRKMMILQNGSHLPWVVSFYLVMLLHLDNWFICFAPFSGVNENSEVLTTLQIVFQARWQSCKKDIFAFTQTISLLCHLPVWLPSSSQYTWATQLLWSSCRTLLVAQLFSSYSEVGGCIVYSSIENIISKLKTSIPVWSLHNDAIQPHFGSVIATTTPTCSLKISRVKEQESSLGGNNYHQYWYWRSYVQSPLHDRQ